MGTGEENSRDTRPSAGSWVAVAAAWVAVGVPLLWGVYQTVKKAALLFK